MRHLTQFLAVAFVVGLFGFGGLVAESVAPAGSVARAEPGVSVAGPTDYFPERFGDVKVWDESPQPEAF